MIKLEISAAGGVHGGPRRSDAALAGCGIWRGALSALGYFVFMPIRAAAMDRERSYSANIKDFGYGDLRDILAGWMVGNASHR
jgi:hypothetical protein